MATREENLKKINAELEKLSDEELDNVAGGGNIESSNDTRFLNVLNGSILTATNIIVWIIIKNSRRNRLGSTQ